MSSSTVQNQADISKIEHNYKTQRNDLTSRTQSRRESRILIQPLPRLFTKSKYEGFRQAKSTERRAYHTTRDHLNSSKVKYFSPKEDDKRDSLNNIKDASSGNLLDIPKHHGELSSCRVGQGKKSDCPTAISSTFKSPKNRSTGVAKLSKVSAISSDEKTIARSKARFENRGSIVNKNKLRTSSNNKSKLMNRTGVIYPSINYKSTTEFSIDNGRENQIRTLSHHLNIINQRKLRLISEITAIDKIIQGDKSMASKKIKTSRNSYIPSCKL